MPDNTARVLHNFDEQTGGAENPHIRDPDTGVFRKFIHSDVFVSNNIPRALRKYRTANDREIHYGNDRGRFSLFCYAYIFEANDIKRARFIDVGIGRNQVIRLVATSALVSHLFQSCQGDATKLLIMGWESKMQLPHGFHSKHYMQSTP